MSVNKTRKARGLSQADLAEMVGVNQATISKLENLDEGCTIGRYMQYAAALGVTLADLFGEDRSEIEARLIEAFRKIPQEQHARVLGLLEIAESLHQQEV